jgi:hypothetical protein
MKIGFTEIGFVIRPSVRILCVSPISQPLLHLLSLLTWNLYSILFLDTEMINKGVSRVK